MHIEKNFPKELKSGGHLHAPPMEEIGGGLMTDGGGIF